MLSGHKISRTTKPQRAINVNPELSTIDSTETREPRAGSSCGKALKALRDMRKPIHITSMANVLDVPEIEVDDFLKYGVVQGLIKREQKKDGIWFSVGAGVPLRLQHPMMVRSVESMAAEKAGAANGEDTDHEVSKPVAAPAPAAARVVIHGPYSPRAGTMGSKAIKALKKLGRSVYANELENEIGAVQGSLMQHLEACLKYGVIVRWKDGTRNVFGLPEHAPTEGKTTAAGVDRKTLKDEIVIPVLGRGNLIDIAADKRNTCEVANAPVIAPKHFRVGIFSDGECWIEDGDEVRKYPRAKSDVLAKFFQCLDVKE